MSRRPSPAELANGLKRFAMVVAVTAAAGLATAMVGLTVQQASKHQASVWILGRAAGITSYLLMVALVAFGLVLSHPWRTRLRRPSAGTRIRIHASFAVFTLAFTVLHVVVLVMDSYAGVGLRGAFIPLASSYRPVPVTLGLIGAYAGLLAGLTAALAGRLTWRIWWPVHKVSALSLVLVWLHGVLAGSDSLSLRALYFGTGAVLLLLAASRYMAATPADRVAELVDELPSPYERSLAGKPMSGVHAGERR
jgi:hypothetical protein